jgi:hypothetical protein
VKKEKIINLLNFSFVLIIIRPLTNIPMIDKTSTPSAFRSGNAFGNSSHVSLSETHVSIQNEHGNEVRVIRMNSRADGIVEIEMRDTTENAPFRYSRN